MVNFLVLAHALVERILQRLCRPHDKPIVSDVSHLIRQHLVLDATLLLAKSIIFERILHELDLEV